MLTGSGLKEKIELSFRQWLGDYAMTALRLRKGIDLRVFHEKYGLHFEDFFEEEISRMLEWRFLQLDAGCLQLTRKALAISNSIFLEFI
jgi:coproporphyrinogen III oxidase-like Fe-S oxidoreductase